MSEPDDLESLIQGYTAGELDAAQLKRLLALVESSPAARQQLAEAAVTDRLLRSLVQGGVPSKRILQAVAAERARGLRSGRGRESSPFGAALILVCLALGIGLLLFFNPFQKEPDPISKQPSNAEPEPGPNPEPKPGPPPVATTSNPAPTRVDATAATELYRPFPLEPPPLEEPGLEPPQGDGSGEPGFVAPPAQWAEREVAARDETAPAPPLLWVKLELDDPRHWNAVPDDLSALLVEIRKRWKLNYRVETRRLDAVEEDPTANPILFLSTHYHFRFTPEERARLRRFLLNGGMMVFNAGLGSTPARDSARRELRQIFPELPVETLGSDHPIYHAYHELEPQREATLEGITLSCRAAAVISSWGLSAGWAGYPHEAPRAYPREEALRLGVNLFSYATAIRAWARQDAQVVTVPASRSGDRLYLAQVRHSGTWRTRYTALPRLLQSFNQLTEVPVQVDVRALRLDEPALFNHPLLYLTGHEPLRLSRPEIEALGRYLRNGGFLFAEACCGRKGFDRSFRALMQHLFPEQALEVLPPEAAVFRQPNPIEMLGTTRSLGAKRKSIFIQPRLEGLRLEGHLAVIYSPYGLAGAWEASPHPYADGYEGQGALKLGQNILMQAITQ